MGDQIILNTGLEQALSVERDLRCLGNIQFRFRVRTVY